MLTLTTELQESAMSALPKYVHVDHRIITGVIDRLSNKNSASEWLRWMIDDVLDD